MPFRNIISGVPDGTKIAITIASMTAGFSDTANTDDTDNDFTTTGGAADGEWYARKFTAVNTGKVQYAQTEMLRLGTVAGTVVGMIYSDDGGAPSVPDAQIGDDSNAVTNSTLTVTPGTTEEFIWGGNEGQDGDGPDIVAGTAYWLVMKTVGYTYNNGVSEIVWRTDANGAAASNECAKYDSNAGTPWTSVGADVGADLRIGSSANFVSIADAIGDALPNQFEIVKVTIKPSVATVYEMVLFSNSTRLREDTEWETTWYDGKEATQEVFIDAQPYKYNDGTLANSVWGSIRIQPTINASAFEIAITYI